MAGDAATTTLLLFTEESVLARALLKEAAGPCSALLLSEFLLNLQQPSPPKERIFFSLTKEQQETAAAAAARLLSLLQADGLLVVAVEGADGSDTLAAIGRSFLYAGFVSADSKEILANVLKSAKNSGIYLGAFKKPKWAVGASVAVGSAGDDLVDEDTLIDTSETYRPIGKGRSDCASRPRACANCTCGRKEAEEAADKEAFKKLLESGAVRSSCGNCYLGDAFRCAGCPYKGLPAFRPGEKVDLSAEAQRASSSAVGAAGSETVAETVARAGVTVASGSNKVTLVSLDDDC